jgi:hypothetical protein
MDFTAQSVNSTKIHLHDFPRLRSVRLNAQSCIPLIQTLFEGLQKAHPLEEICIMEASPNLEVWTWVPLDAYFTHADLGHLRRVDFQMIEEDLSSMPIGYGFNQFPILCERGMVHASLLPTILDTFTS